MSDSSPVSLSVPPAEKLFHLLMENVENYAIFNTDPEGHILTWNLGAERILGYTGAEASGQLCDLIFTPEDRAKREPDRERTLAARNGHAMDERWHMRKDGSRFWASGVMTALFEPSGELSGYVKILRDFTRQKQIQDALEASHARVAEILESITDAFYAVDADFHLTYVNRKAEEWWGRRREELVGKHFWSLFPQAVGSDVYERHLRAMEARTPQHFETLSPVLAKWIEAHIFPTREGGLSVYFRDITERRQAAEAQRASEDRLRTALHAIQEGLAITDAEGRFVLFNDSTLRILGLTYDQMMGRTALDPRWKALDADGSVFPPERYPVAVVLRDYQPVSGVIMGVYRPDEDIVWVEINAAPLLHPGEDKPFGAVASFIDITERRRAEAEIVDLNKRLHRAVYESSHRIKNHLQLLAATAELSVMGAAEQVPAEQVRRLGTQARMLAQIHDLLTTQTKTDVEDRTLSVRALLMKVMAILPQTGDGGRFSSHIADATVSLHIATALALIVNELVTNAAKHGKSEIEVEFRVENGQGVLEVRDDGPGFPAGFDPKRAANTGLELLDSLARHDLNGQVEFKNREEGGAHVIVTFPLPR